MWKKISLSLILVAYFVFTSGFVFEATKSNSINRLDIPYSAISGERTGVIGTFYTNNDLECVKWLVSNNDRKSHIYADINGQLLLSGYIEPYTQLVEVFSWKVFFEEPCYIFLTEWNIDHSEMVWHTGQAGLREAQPIPWDILNKKQMIHAEGKAKIWK